MKKVVDDGRDGEELCFLLVLAPFVIAFGLFGCSLAVVSGRFLFDLLANGGQFSCVTDSDRR